MYTVLCESIVCTLCCVSYLHTVHTVLCKSLVCTLCCVSHLYVQCTLCCVSHLCVHCVVQVTCAGVIIFNINFSHVQEMYIGKAEMVRSESIITECPPRMHQHKENSSVTFNCIYLYAQCWSDICLACCHSASQVYHCVSIIKLVEEDFLLFRLIGSNFKNLLS